jgi:hypothetical protein
MMQILYIIVQLEVVIAVGVCRIEALQALSHFYAGGHEHRMLNEKRCRDRYSPSSFDIGLLKTNTIKLRSEATSLFDVRCLVYS